MAAKTGYFAQELQQILDSLGISKADVSRRLNCSQMHVGNLVRGTRHATPELINALSHSLLLSPRHRLRLHRAAALDRGFQLLPSQNNREKRSHASG